MRLGVCYYPEQWPQERWKTDAQMMRENGLELVRLGELAWATYEPARARFDWAWLDAAIDTIADTGLHIVLGTPTAAPPIWLALERPEIQAVDNTGRRVPYGGRRYTCPTSPAYRLEAARIVSALVARYGNHEGIAAWQVDDQPGTDDSARCWCSACQSAFSSWLQHRFGSIDVLNETWGTSVWSQVYPSFAAVRLPTPARVAHSPSLLLAHRRFASEQVLSGLAEQVRLIRAVSPDRVITVNHFLAQRNGADVEIDKSGAITGTSAHNSYPHACESPLEVSFTHDLCRGLAPAGAASWVAEQQVGPVSWLPGKPPITPGQVRLWGWQAALHGIDTMVFFRWRTARAGQEQYDDGLLRHDGEPTSGLAEVRRLAEEINIARMQRPALLKPDDSSRRAALLHAVDDAWAMDIAPQREGANHRSLIMAAYTAMRRVGLEVDVRSPTDDLTGYELVVAPASPLVTADRVAALEAAAAAGALVVLGPQAFMRDVENTWVDGPVPGGSVAEKTGVRVVGEKGDTARLTVTIGKGHAPPVDAGPVATVYGLDESAASGRTTVIAHYTGGTPFDGRPAAVRAGSFLFAGFSSESAWTALFALLLGRDEPLPTAREIFHRAGANVTIDYLEGTVAGVPNRGPS